MVISVWSALNWSWALGPIVLDSLVRVERNVFGCFTHPGISRPTDRKTPRRSPAGVRLPGQAASAGSAAVASWTTAMISAAVFWMRLSEAASVSALPSKSWM